MTKWVPRHAEPADIKPLAQLWLDQWTSAHAAYVPADLTRLRTLEDFETRLVGFGNRVITAGAIGGPQGLCVVTEDELDQIYVAPSAQGTGLAKILLQDAETRISQNGFSNAWLACLRENERALRFYTRNGWARSEIRIVMLNTAKGKFPLEVQILSKSVFAA